MTRVIENNKIIISSSFSNSSIIGLDLASNHVIVDYSDGPEEYEEIPILKSDELYRNLTFPVENIIKEDTSILTFSIETWIKITKFSHFNADDEHITGLLSLGSFIIGIAKNGTFACEYTASNKTISGLQYYNNRWMHYICSIRLNTLSISVDSVPLTFNATLAPSDSTSFRRFKFENTKDIELYISNFRMWRFDLIISGMSSYSKHRANKAVIKHYGQLLFGLISLSSIDLSTNYPPICKVGEVYIQNEDCSPEYVRLLDTTKLGRDVELIDLSFDSFDNSGCCLSFWSYIVNSEYSAHVNLLKLNSLEIRYKHSNILLIGTSYEVQSKESIVSAWSAVVVCIDASQIYANINNLHMKHFDLPEKVLEYPAILTLKQGNSLFRLIRLLEYDGNMVDFNFINSIVNYEQVRLLPDWIKLSAHFNFQEGGINQGPLVANKILQSVGNSNRLSKYTYIGNISTQSGSKFYNKVAANFCPNNLHYKFDNGKCLINSNSHDNNVSYGIKPNSGKLSFEIGDPSQFTILFWIHFPNYLRRAFEIFGFYEDEATPTTDVWMSYTFEQDKRYLRINNNITTSINYFEAELWNDLFRWEYVGLQKDQGSMRIMTERNDSFEFSNWNEIDSSQILNYLFLGNSDSDEDFVLYYLKSFKIFNYLVEDLEADLFFLNPKLFKIIYSSVLHLPLWNIYEQDYLFDYGKYLTTSPLDISAVSPSTYLNMLPNEQNIVYGAVFNANTNPVVLKFTDSNCYKEVSAMVLFKLYPGQSPSSYSIMRILSTLGVVYDYGFMKLKYSPRLMDLSPSKLLAIDYSKWIFINLSLFQQSKSLFVIRYTYINGAQMKRITKVFPSFSCVDNNLIIDTPSRVALGYYRVFHYALSDSELMDMTGLVFTDKIHYMIINIDLRIRTREPIVHNYADGTKVEVNYPIAHYESIGDYGLCGWECIATFSGQLRMVERKTLMILEEDDEILLAVPSGMDTTPVPAFSVDFWIKVTQIDDSTSTTASIVELGIGDRYNPLI